MAMRVSLCALSLLIASTAIVPVAAAQALYKIAYLNIQSGKGEPGLAGRPVLFADTQNCTDRTQPINAWGAGLIQAELERSVRDDPAVLAIGLGEAFLCGSPANVQKVLGWKARTSERNGVALVARHGFAGPESWQQLDTSLNENPADTAWVVRVPVCADALCVRSVLVYTAHWYGTGTYKRTVYDLQAQQTVDFLARTAGDEPHVLIGDLNAWEGTSMRCNQTPTNAGIARLREAGYVDAWPALHGSLEGYTGMTNRAGCGSPEGYAWKRIDYAWSSPRLEPLDITRFGIPEVIGDAAISDHYGVLVSYAGHGPDTLLPTVTVTSPAPATLVSGTIDIQVAATDDVGVSQVEVLLEGAVLRTLTAAPYTASLNTSTRVDGTHTVQARAYDAAGNVGVSSAVRFEIRNTVRQPDPSAADIVLYAARARTAGNWRVLADATAAGGKAMENPDGNASKLTTPLAQPASYFELSFTPAPGTAYRLWVRARAQKDSWANDSVFVQFSGSMDAHGTATYRIGTSGGTTVNLEDGADVGISGWGWQDNGYGVNVLGPLLYFSGATQTLRVQPREDGIVIDQIVLSPVTYLDRAPGALTRDTVVLPETTPVALDEIVLRASLPSIVAGTWRVVGDTTAADGLAFLDPDAGAPKASAAAAVPVSYVDLTFSADAGRDYRLWIRGRAERNAWTNDSVFVQFSRAVDAAGAPLYRIGTTSAAVINLEDASGAGLEGWGWQDNGYGAGVLGPLVRFQSSGVQTLRVQSREDGLRIDQVVLSSAKYLAVAPGATKGDTTILK